MKNMKLRIKYDKNIEKLLLPGETAEVDAINNSLLRKHFRTLTSSFLSVFDEYFDSKTNVRSDNIFEDIFIDLRITVGYVVHKDF